MLNVYLPESRIQLVEYCNDWQQAIRICATPLLKEGLIENRYLHNIFELFQKLGPYFVVAPHIAMPHARPEDGAINTGLSLLVVKQGVRFNSENDPVYLIVMLAANNTNNHLNMLAQLAEFLANEEDVLRVTRSSSITEISEVISHY
ncbi:MAG: PTS sugar transporter subunit IIA [[Pasteurella] aerogenes]|nr:PTS sugar transporter subunit IIA [[Pasteurella] aerogenes]